MRGARVLVVVCLSLLLPSVAIAASGPKLSVNVQADRHRISPLIYGLNYGSRHLMKELQLPLDRWGGNTTDTYNRQLGSYNTGNDYFFENVADCFAAAYGYCADGPVSGYRKFIAADRAVGAKTLLTLPMMGRIASDAPIGHPLTCGFPASVFPVQDDFDPYDAGCGSGERGGVPLAADPARDSIATPAGYIPAWIADLKQRYGSAAGRGVAFYELGNEPALWNSTHRDMHPDPVTYDELWTRGRDLAKQVKQADPTAKTLGPSEWGWPNYFCSAADNIDNGCFASSPDRAAHGGKPLAAWYLERMRGEQQAHGTRLLDYFDLHYYAQGGNDTEVTRSLWDPTYTDPSWIGDQIDLIPRMHGWVYDNYPGTKLALSEYNLSVGDPVTNALIQADTLGIFARQGLDLATRWPLGNDGPLIDDAFRIYRNYDGSGARFGNRWVRSKSADQGRLALYAAQRGSRGKLTILAINKSGSALHSKLSLAGFMPRPTAQVFRWTGDGIHRGGRITVARHGFTADYPRRSMTLFVLRPQRRG